MPLTHAQIEQVAPDQTSLNAARKLLKANKWPVLGVDEKANAIFGDCQGSGAAPYRVAVDLQDLVAKCSCPSRKFPCKHALALMWWFADEAGRFSSDTIPAGAQEWLTRRRQRGGNPAPAKADKPKGERPKLASATPAEEISDDKRTEQAAKARERNRAKREASILAGLDELDRWIGDVSQEGLAAFPTSAAQQCLMLARRLVDAKAGGIAKRLEAFPSEYFETAEPERPDLLIEFLGELHLLASAYRRQQDLDSPLRAELRRLVGWTQSRDELLEAADAQRVSGRWRVLGLRYESQPDHLVRFETWLLCLETQAENPPQTAVLLEFVPAAMAAKAAPAYARGQTLDATLAFYPSPTPLVALVAEHRGATEGQCEDDGTLPVPPSDLRLALDTYRDRLVRNPWLRRWPLAFHSATLHHDEQESYWFHSPPSDSGSAVRVHPDHAEDVSTLAGLDPIGVYGVYDGRYLTPIAASTPLGPWWGSSSG
ncbi:MAG: SWIM zinc finger family protein [Pseudomonadota bacterium]